MQYNSSFEFDLNKDVCRSLRFVLVFQVNSWLTWKGKRKEYSNIKHDVAKIKYLKVDVSVCVLSCFYLRSSATIGNFVINQSKDPIQVVATLSQG